MEPVKERSSTLSQSRPLSNSGKKKFDEPQCTARYGIESRNTVLQQFREHSDVIMLDSDDELDHDSLAAVTERRNGRPSSFPSTRVQIVNPTMASSSPTQARVNDHKPSSKIASKRRLFRSTNAKENMYKISGLPSPPRSDKDSPQSSSGSNADERCGHTSWSFENLETQQPDSLDQEWGFDIGDAGALSMRLARLVNSDAVAEITHTISPAKPLPALETAMNAKDALEAKGIARSQQLRAKRKPRVDEQQLPSVAADSDPHSTVNTTYKIRQVRENQWEDLEEIPAGETESQLYDVTNFLGENWEHIKVRSLETKRKNDKHKNRHSSRQNPYSRDAANQYRTQSRHIDHDDEDAAFARKILADNEKPDVVSEEEQRRREERLIRMKVTAAGGLWDPSPKPVKDVPRPRSLARFYSPFDDKPKLKHNGLSQRPQTQTRDAIRELMGTSTSKESSNTTSDNNVDSDVNESNGPSNSTLSNRDAPTLSVLEQLSALKPVTNRDVEKSCKVEDRYAMLPPQGEDLTLPKNIATMSESRRGLIIKRETLKERHKDLNIILEVYKEFATLLAVEKLRDVDVKHLGEVKDYTAAVLDRDRSGKRARRRMMDIRDSIRRRLQTRALDPDERAVNIQLQDIMLTRYYEKLQNEMITIPTQLRSVMDELDRSHKAFQVHADRLRRSRTRAQANVPGSRTLSHPSKFERYYRSVEEKIALFDKGSALATTAEDSRELDIVDTEENAGIVSEEDAVDEFMRPFSRANKPIQSGQEDLPIGGVNSAEIKRQKANTADNTYFAQSTQAADMSLLQKMIAKAAQADHAASQGVQKHDSQIQQNMLMKEAAQAEQKTLEAQIVVTAESEEHTPEAVKEDAIEVGSSHEFDDSDLNEEKDEETANEEDDDEFSQPVCRRYVVKSCITGISPHYDNDLYLIGKYLSRKKAIKKVLEIAPWMTKEYLKRNPDSQSPCFISLKDAQGEYEQQMTLGHDGVAECRTWIEEELYNPSEEAYEKAKVYRACQPQEAWFVDWERTIKLMVEEDEDEETQEVHSIEEHGPTQNLSHSTTTSDMIEQKPSAETGIGEATVSKPQNLTATDTEHDQKAAPTKIDDTVTSSLAHSTIPHIEGTTNLRPQPCTTSYSSLDVDDDDNDDLFGPDPSPESFPFALPGTPSTSISMPPNMAEAPVTTRATGDQFRIFSNLALANRHAKDIFMRWFIDHLRGPGNFHYITGEDESMEEQLKRVGDRAAWSREEEFDVIGHDGLKRNDTFKVWVRKARSSGPGN